MENIKRPDDMARGPDSHSLRDAAPHAEYPDHERREDVSSDSREEEGGDGDGPYPSKRL